MKIKKQKFYPRCSTILIGSLPYQNPQEALKAVFTHSPDLPSWPQLPKKSLREGMLLQFMENFNFLEVSETTVVLRPDWSSQLEKFFAAIINRDLDYFSISSESAAGLTSFLSFVRANKPKAEFLKGQITGPFTFSSAIKGPDGNSLLFDTQLLDAVISGLAMKVAWQAREFKRLDKRAIIFIDEPYLACFGSGFTPVNRQDVIEVLNRLIEAIGEPDCLVGLHCCANTDWSMLLETDIDIINFDAFSYLERFTLYPQELKRFLARGGTIAWGIVPTAEYKSGISVLDLVSQFEEGLAVLSKKGLDSRQILEKSLITPSCGMGSLSIEITEKALELLSQTSQALKDKYSLNA
jgi:methionine synthase II (cobalamin-independent)